MTGASVGLFLGGVAAGLALAAMGIIMLAAWLGAQMRE